MIVFRVEGHFVVSFSRRGCKCGDSASGARREIVVTVPIVDVEGVARSVERIWEPTAPVLPNIAEFVVILSGLFSFFNGIWFGVGKGSVLN